jgi:Flp pilus assembly protein TadB
MRSVKQAVQVSAGIALIAVGIPIFILPIPIGIFIIGAGLFLLVRSWPRARFARIRLRQRFPAFFRRLDDAARRFARRKAPGDTPT